MKKLLILILALCMVFPLAACGRGDNGKTTGGDDTQPADLKAWAMHSYQKTVVNIAPKGTLKTDYTVYLAKGETEGCQVAVYSKDGTPYIVFCNSQGQVLLLDALTGETLHSLNTGGGNIEGSPAIYDNKIIIGTRGKRIYCIEIK